MHALLFAVALAASSASLGTRALEILGKWTEAQNAADVAGYAALYDTAKFHGTKRAPRGTTQYDWKAWIADRTKMMGAHPTVAVERATVELWSDRKSKLTKNTIRVRFLQRWRSARYADHGIKIIDLAYDAKADKLLVRREELLNSLPGWSADEPIAVRLASPRTAREAKTALAAMRLTAGDAQRKLASITDPSSKKLLAGAILDGNLTCERAEHLEECGEEVHEWSPLEPTLAWPDPCVNRLAALWAIAQLDGKELKVLADKLVPIFAYALPERELPEAILNASTGGDDATRLRFLRAAVDAGRIELANANVVGLGPHAIVVAATELRLSKAIGLLNPKRDLAAILALVQDEALDVDDRVGLVQALETLRGKTVDATLRSLAGATSCRVAMAAASALAVHGDASLLPRRGRGDAERALCMVLRDPDPARADARLPDFIGPRGVTLTIASQGEILGEGEEPPAPTVTTIARQGATVADLPPELADALEGTVTPANFSYELRDGRLVSMEVTRWSGCGC